MNDDDERLRKMYLRLMRAAPAFNPVVSNIWCCWVLSFAPGYGFSLPETVDVRSETLLSQCNARVMILRKLGVIFVVTLCSGRSAYAMRAPHR